jgi:N-acyl-D-aspartate/D-glutamate deacylase
LTGAIRLLACQAGAAFALRLNSRKTDTLRPPVCGAIRLLACQAGAAFALLLNSRKTDTLRPRLTGAIRLSPLLAALAAGAAAQSYDLVLRNGRILDGSGNAWYRADLAISGGRIAAVGRIDAARARRAIDIAGHFVAPGFVDMMGATSEPLLADRAAAESKLRQGITTLLAGEGGSVAPSERWPRFEPYFRELEARGIAINVVHNVGAAQVRRMVLGVENRAPSPQELDRMRVLVDEAMRDGAVGLSTALIYPPGTYAGTAELVELARVAGRYGGIYLTHMRNESYAVLDAVRESMEIGEKAGVPVHIFHLKAAGEDNWPLMQKAVDLIQAARDGGRDVTADIYPYVRNGIGLGSFLHPRHYGKGAAPFVATLRDPAVRRALRDEVESTGDWENWYRHVGRNWDNVLVASVGAGTDKKFEAKSVAAIAKMRGVDEWTAFFDLVAAGEVSVNPRSMNEEQKHLALRTEWVSVCTDAAPTAMAKATGAHPRTFGSFPRVLAHYVREGKVISWEAAIRKMSSLAANRLGLYDRGRIAPGLAADLVVFDPEKVQDKATFENPLQHPEGIPYVIVNGAPVIDGGRFTAANPGRVLRRR